MTRIPQNQPPSASPSKHRVGETKTEGGHTYRLNEHWRWERADNDENESPDEPQAVGEPEATHEQRHAIAAENLKLVNKPIAGVIRALHESPEYKSGKAVTTTALHPSVHANLYANLKQNAGQEMSGGRVVDFGGGRLGFASKAGSLILWQNGRIAYTNQTGLVDGEALQGRNLTSIDEDEGDVIPTADEDELDTPATTSDRTAIEEAAMMKHGVNRLADKSSKELRDAAIATLDSENKRKTGKEQSPELLNPTSKAAAVEPAKPPETKPDHKARAAEIASKHAGDGWDLMKSHAKEFAENPELVDHVREAFEAKENTTTEPQADEPTQEPAVEPTPAESVPPKAEPQQAEAALSERLAASSEAVQSKASKGLGLTPDFEAKAAEQIRKMRERRAAKDRTQSDQSGPSTGPKSDTPKGALKPNNEQPSEPLSQTKSGLTPDFEKMFQETMRKKAERRAAKEAGSASPAVTEPVKDNAIEPRTVVSAEENQSLPSMEKSDPETTTEREPPSYMPKKWNHPKWKSHVANKARDWEMTPDEYESIANDVFSKYADHHKARESARDDAKKSTGLDDKDIAWLEENGHDFASDPKKIKGKVPRRKPFSERFKGGGFGLDDTARSLASQFPGLGWGGGYGSGDEGEGLDSKLWELLREGKGKPLTRLSPEFHEEVDQYIQNMVNRHSSGGGSRPGTEPKDEDWSSVPFQKGQSDFQRWMYRKREMEKAAASTYSKQWDESKHPRGQPENAGEFVESRNIHKSLVAHRESRERFIRSGNAAAFRIHDATKPLPKKSANSWYSDDDMEMPGVSGYANLSNAILDMMTGQSESATGDNYTSGITGDSGHPSIIVMDGVAKDGPGAEVIVNKPKISAVFTFSDVENEFRKMLDAIGIEHDGKTLEDISDEYDFEDSDIQIVVNGLIESLK